MTQTQIGKAFMVVEPYANGVGTTCVPVSPCVEYGQKTYP
jgi:hypothetical protein